MVRDWVLDDAEELLLRSGGSDGEAMEELDHETGESFESARNADGRVDFDQDALGCVNVYLQFTGFVDGRVEQSEQALELMSVRSGRLARFSISSYLVGNVWSGIANISAHLAHDANVLVTVEQRVLVIARRGCSWPMRGTIRL